MKCIAACGPLVASGGNDDLIHLLNTQVGFTRSSNAIVSLQQARHGSKAMMYHAAKYGKVSSGWHREWKRERETNEQ